ncbi:MAG: HNH endonuclease [Gammaproteobacteria bacterium]|nr:HNH endonuclease [Gammaproteobacteria bacterium]
MNTKVLKLDITGRPLKWVNIKEAAVLFTTQKIAWSVGDPILMIQGGINRLTGKRSRLHFAPVIAVHSRNLRGRSLCPPLLNRFLFARDSFFCLYCGEKFSPTDLTRDHIFPQGRGGLDTWENCVTACKRCNHTKGCRTPEEANMKLLAVPYKPNHFEFLALSNRHILADQMEFLEKGFSRKRLLA